MYEYNRAAAKSEKGTFNRHAYKSIEDIIQIPNGCPRIVKDEVWDKVNALSKTNSPNGDYLLSGLVYCKCGAKIQVNKRKSNKNHKEYISFFCPNHKNTKTCDGKEIRMDRIEEAVLYQLGEIIFSDESIKNFIEAYPTLNKKSILQSKKKIKRKKGIISQNEGKILNCTNQIADGCSKATAKILDNKIAELAKENDKLNEQIKALSTELSAVPTKDEIKKLKKKFMKNNMQIRKSWLQSMVRIYVYDDHVNIIIIV